MQEQDFVGDRQNGRDRSDVSCFAEKEYAINWWNEQALVAQMMKACQDCCLQMYVSVCYARHGQA